MPRPPRRWRWASRLTPFQWLNCSIPEAFKLSYFNKPVPKRLTRFFRGFAINFDDIVRAVVSWSQIHEPWTLSLDRTNWCFGTVNINILMLRIVYEGVAFPVMWTMLDKRGNSNSDELIDLLDRFGRVFPHAQIHCLTRDRELVGKEWCSFLLSPKALPFRLRLRHSDRISSHSGKHRQPGERVFANLTVGEQRVLSGKRWMWGRRVYVVATRLEDGELLILATNHRPETALADYRLRWGIETLFAALKSRGFNLELPNFRVISFLESSLFATALFNSFLPLPCACRYSIEAAARLESSVSDRRRSLTSSVNTLAS
ncbi:MAG: IS4 family transposase [Leptolyngbya sp.]|nr:MAG: IS4 family transposase [Leptolyngbya sp.]